MVAYDEILEFVTSSPTLEQIIAFRLSDRTRQRIRELIEASRKRVLTEQEQYELDEFTRMQYFMDGLKKRAQRRVVRR